MLSLEQFGLVPLDDSGAAGSPPVRSSTRSAFRRQQSRPPVDFAGMGLVPLDSVSEMPFTPAETAATTMQGTLDPPNLGRKGDPFGPQPSVAVEGLSQLGDMPLYDTSVDITFDNVFDVASREQPYPIEGWMSPKQRQQAWELNELETGELSLLRQREEAVAREAYEAETDPALKKDRLVDLQIVQRHNALRREELARERAEASESGLSPFEYQTARDAKRRQERSSGIPGERILDDASQGFVEPFETVDAFLPELRTRNEAAVKQRELESAREEAIQTELDKDSPLGPQVSGFARHAARAAGRMAPSVMAGAATGSAGVAFGLMSTDAGLAAFNEGRAGGMGKAEATGYGVVMGGIEALTEVMGGKVANLLGTQTFVQSLVKPSAKSVAKALLGTGVEGVEETAAETLGMVADYYFGLRDSVFDGNSLGEIAEAGLIGVVLGAGGQAPSVAAYYANPNRKRATDLDLPEAVVADPVARQTAAAVGEALAEAMRPEGAPSFKPAPIMPVAAEDRAPQASPEAYAEAESRAWQIVNALGGTREQFDSLAYNARTSGLLDSEEGWQTVIRPFREAARKRVELRRDRDSRAEADSVKPLPPLQQPKLDVPATSEQVAALKRRGFKAKDLQGLTQAEYETIQSEGVTFSQWRDYRKAIEEERKAKLRASFAPAPVVEAAPPSPAQPPADAPPALPVESGPGPASPVSESETTGPQQTAEAPVQPAATPTGSAAESTASADERLAQMQEMVDAAMPEAENSVVRVGDRRFRVTFGSGVAVDVEEVDRIELSESAIQSAMRDYGLADTPANRDLLARGPAGMVLVHVGDESYDSLGVIKLRAGLGTSAPQWLRHELIHFAKRTGAIEPQVWDKLVDRYAKGVADPGRQEELVVRGIESHAAQHAPTWTKIARAIDSLLAMMGVRSDQINRTVEAIRSGKLFAAKETEKPEAKPKKKRIGDRKPKRPAEESVEKEPPRKPEPELQAAEPEPSRKSDSMSEADLAAAIERQMLADESIGETAATSVPKQPAPKRRPAERRPKPPSPIAEKAADARAELADAISEVKDILKDMGFLGSGAPLNPKLVAAVSKMGAKAVKVGVYTFAEFVDLAAKEFTPDVARKIAAYLDREWDAVGKILPGEVDAAGSAADILASQETQADETQSDETQHSDKSVAGVPADDGLPGADAPGAPSQSPRRRKRRIGDRRKNAGDAADDSQAAQRDAGGDSGGDPGDSASRAPSSESGLAGPKAAKPKAPKAAGGDAKGKAGVLTANHVIGPDDDEPSGRPPRMALVRVRGKPAGKASSGKALSIKQSLSPVAKRPGDASKEATAAQDIVKTWSRIFDVPILPGGIAHRTAAGLYNYLTRVVRLAEPHLLNLAVAAHEIGHHVDNLAKITDPESGNFSEIERNELEGLDYEPLGRAEEGFAVFVSRWITEQDAAVVAPNVNQRFEQWLNQNEEWRVKFHEARKQARAYGDQSAFQRISSAIGRGAKDLSWYEQWKGLMRSKAMRLMESQVDKFAALSLIDAKLGEAGWKGMKPGEVAMVYDMTAVAHAEKAIDGGVFSIRTEHSISDIGLWKAGEYLENEGEYDDAVAYAYAKHVLFMQEKRGGEYRAGPMHPEDAAAWVAQVKKDGRAARFDKFARVISDFGDALLDMLVDAGAVPKKTVEALKDYYGGNYFPLVKVADGNSDQYAGAGFVNLPSAIGKRSRDGSDRPIVDPFDQMMLRAIHDYSRAAKARVAISLFNALDPQLGGVEGFGGFLDRYPPGRQVTKGVISEILGTLVEEGVVDPNLARSMRIAADLIAGNHVGTRRRRWFGRQHGVSPSDDGAMLAAAEQVPNAAAVISLWRQDLTPNKSKRTVVHHTPDGEQILYQMDDMLYRVATGLNRDELGPVLSVMREASSVMKTGATGISTAFAAGNLVMDYAEYQGRAKYVKGVKGPLVQPIVQLARYIGAKLRSQLTGKPLSEIDATADFIERTGGKIYTRLGDDASRKRLRRRRLGLKRGEPLTTILSIDDIKSRLKEAAATVEEAMREITSWSDLPPRMAEAEAAIMDSGYEKAGGKWREIGTDNVIDFLPEHVKIKAVLAAANATVNFKRGGTKAAAREAILPFSRSQVNGLYRKIELLANLKHLSEKSDQGDQARRFLFYKAALVGITAGIWLARRDDDDYIEMDEYERRRHWTLGWRGREVARVPKPRDELLTINIVENMLNSFYQADGDKTDVLGGAARDVADMLPSGGGAAIGLIETYFNWDSFRGREIEPPYMARDGVPVEHREDAYTLESSKILSRAVGKYLGLSPMKVQHLLSSATGGTYERWSDFWESALVGEMKGKHVPFVGRFFPNRWQAKSVRDFYRSCEDARIEAYREKMESADSGSGGPAADKLRRLNSYREVISAVRTAAPKDSRGRPTDAFLPYLVGLSREALGRKPLPYNPSPFQSGLKIPEPVKAAILKHAIGEVRTGIASFGRPTSGKDLAGRLARWESKRQQAREWLLDHAGNEIVKQAVAEVLGPTGFQDIQAGRLPLQDEKIDAADKRREQEFIRKFRSALRRRAS